MSLPFDEFELFNEIESEDDTSSNEEVITLPKEKRKDLLRGHYHSQHHDVNKKSKDWFQKKQKEKKLEFIESKIDTSKNGFKNRIDQLNESNRLKDQEIYRLKVLESHLISEKAHLESKIIIRDRHIKKLYNKMKYLKKEYKDKHSACLQKDNDLNKRISEIKELEKNISCGTQELKKENNDLRFKIDSLNYELEGKIKLLAEKNEEVSSYSYLKENEIKTLKENFENSITEIEMERNSFDNIKNELCSKLDELNNLLNTKNDEIEKIRNSYSDLSDQLIKVQKEVDIREESIKKADLDLIDCKNKIENLQLENSILEKTNHDLKFEYHKFKENSEHTIRTHIIEYENEFKKITLKESETANELALFREEWEKIKTELKRRDSEVILLNEDIEKYKIQFKEKIDEVKTIQLNSELKEKEFDKQLNELLHEMNERKDREDIRKLSLMNLLDQSKQEINQNKKTIEDLKALNDQLTKKDGEWFLQFENFKNECKEEKLRIKNEYNQIIEKARNESKMLLDEIESYKNKEKFFHDNMNGVRLEIKNLKLENDERKNIINELSFKLERMIEADKKKQEDLIKYEINWTCISTQLSEKKNEIDKFNRIIEENRIEIGGCNQIIEKYKYEVKKLEEQIIFINKIHDLEKKVFEEKLFEVEKLRSNEAELKEKLNLAHHRLQIVESESKSYKMQIGEIEKKETEMELLKIKIEEEIEKFKEDNDRLIKHLNSKNNCIENDQKEIKKQYEQLQTRERQLRQFANIISNERKELQKNYKTLAHEICLASTLHPLKDYLSLTEFELSKLEVELKKTPTLSQERGNLEECFKKLIEQRDLIKKLICTSEKKLENQAKNLLNKAQSQQLLSIPPASPLPMAEPNTSTT